MDIINYLETKGLNPQISGHEAVVTCPVCMKQKLSVNIESGLAQCFVCQAENPESWTAKTHISKIMEYYKDIIQISPITGFKNNKKEKVNFNSLVDRYHYELMNHRKAKKYLINRGITEDSMSRFNLGVVNFKEQEWVSIPTYVNGVCECVKYRKLPPDTTPDLDKNRREFGGNSPLFNGDVLDSYDNIIIFEGELDCISAIQAGFENSVGVTCGAGTLKPEWYDDLLLKNKIYICFDSDTAGQVAAKEVYARRLGFSKCFNVKLPEGIKDANLYFLDHTKEDFEKLIKNAEQYSIENVMTMDDAFKEMYDKSQSSVDNVFPLPWDSVNNLIGGGLSKSELTIIGAPGGTGKTSCAIQIAHYFAKVHKIPSLIFCLEMPVDQLLAKVILNELDMTYGELKYADAYVYKLSMDDLPIYFGYSPTITPEKYYNTVREARNRYGCELFIFDNLQLMVISESPSEYAKAAQMFKSMSMELNIINILISQPRKMNDDSKSMNYNDLYGSISLSQAPDKILLLERKRGKEEGEGAFVSKTKLICDKARTSIGGYVWLQYTGNKSRFDEFK